MEQWQAVQFVPFFFSVHSGAKWPTSTRYFLIAHTLYPLHTNRPAVISGKAAPRYWNYLEDYWSCAGRLSAVNAIGTQSRDLMITRDWADGGWQYKCVDAAAEVGRNPVSKHPYSA